MLTFREFLEARQMMLFSTRPRELYHGTVTGREQYNLRSFKTKGASPMSGGYGQGGGFFVYSDKNSARKQAVSISTGRGSSYRNDADNSGRPMVVTVETTMEPDQWDLDYELNYRNVMEYLLKNFDRVKDKLKSDHVSVEKTVMGLQSWEKKDYHKKREEKPHPLAVPNSNHEELELEPMENWSAVETKERPVGFRVSAIGSKPIMTHLGPARNRTAWHHGKSQDKSGYTQDGETVGIIMNLLQKNDPRTVHSFEELFFSNMGPGVAVKYVGKEPLPVKSIEIADTDGNMMFNQAVDDHYWKPA